MGQHGLNALGARLEASKSQQWIEPYQFAAGEMQTFHLECERVIDVAFESIGDEKHHRALTEHATRPMLVECAQRRGDARAARPVDYVRRTCRQGFIRIALADRTRDIREPRSEKECGYALARVGNCVDKMQK